MRLEDEIKMKSIDNPRLKAVLEILFTSSYINNKHLKYLKPFGLSPQQYNILRILRGSHPKKLTIMDVKSRMLDKMPNTTRLVDKLEKCGCAERERSSKDRRKIFVGITKQGLDVMSQMDVAHLEFMKFTENLNEEEALELSSLIEKLRE